MSPIRCFARILVCFFVAMPLHAQSEKREPLTEDQIEKIREAGIYPDDRVKLYTQFLDERAEVIKGLTNRAKSAARGHRIDGELQDFTALMDEFGSNLDVFSDRHTDIRQSLKPLPPRPRSGWAFCAPWPENPSFDLARKEAIESGEDLADQSTRLLREQTEYFNLHKDEQGQERAEPK